MKPDAHPDDLLSWYVNGTLADAERATVEKHLRECARCRDEVAFLETLRQGVKASGASTGPGELGLKRLMRDVRAQRPAQSLWWKPALAAAALVIVVQGALLANFWPEQDSITPLGESKQAGNVALIRFQPNATEAQLRKLLQDTGATLIDGPGALGIYRLRLEQPDTAIAQLRARTDIVKYVAAQ